MVVSALPLAPWTGVSSDKEQLGFMMLIGDIHWATRTNPSTSFCATTPSSFVQNPGPLHMKAARLILEHMAGGIGQVITYHGSDAALNLVYPHRNKPIGTTDAGFSHAGLKSVSGVSVPVMIYGGAIFYTFRR